MRLRFLDRISQLPATAWNSFFPEHYPFARHAFLDALERYGCATPRTGWTPSHAVLEDRHGQIVAMAPLYLKMHSYGEFVFDFSWAAASQRLGSAYYPKALLAVPFTPCTGPRIGARDAAARAELLQKLVELYADQGLSSLHALFLDKADAAAVTNAGAIERNDVQFHWHNRGDRHFDAFLARLTSEKRKKILRERRRVSEAGIRFEWRAGDNLGEAEWRQVHALYSNTYEERGQAPYLTLEFFLEYGRGTGSPIRLILAYEGARMVAVAITVQGGDTLYGRHWGAAERYHSLHFETCYYQGIDYCLHEGLNRFDAGAQGEHKQARGFEPVLTRSAHWIAEPRLRDAVRRAMAQERAQVAALRDELAAHDPYRHSGVAPRRAEALQPEDGGNG